MRLILVIMLVCCTWQIAWSQPYDSTKLRDINHALATGVACCQQLEVKDSIIVLKDAVIDNLYDQLLVHDQQKTIMREKWQFADSSYRNTVIDLNSSNSEVARLKRGKRTWQLTTAGATVVAILIAVLTSR